MRLRLWILVLLLISPILASASCQENPLELYIDSSMFVNEGEIEQIHVPSSQKLTELKVVLDSDVESTIKIFLDEQFYTLLVQKYVPGQHLVEIQAKDERNCTKNASSLVSIRDVPRIILSDKGPFSLNEGEELILRPQVEDADEIIEIRYRWLIDDALYSTEKDLHYVATYEDRGLHVLTLYVKDSFDLSSKMRWILDVGAQNRAPVYYHPFKDQVIKQNNRITLFNMSNYFKDLEQQKLSYSFEFLPSPNSSISIDEKRLSLNLDQYGIMSTLPKELGNYYLRITATDPFGASVTTDTIHILVKPNEYQAIFQEQQMLCGDGICQEQEDCKCEEDCGPCREAQGACLIDWQCTPWGICDSSGKQKRICQDKNDCKTLDNKPPEEQDCSFNGTCYDLVWNQNEEQVDCGGVCEPCPTCSDAIQNGDESGVDCGGSCAPCPGCADEIQNNNETDVDCGGSCSPCKEGGKCRVSQDCASLNCKTNQCLAASCYDGIQNAEEQGIDCGGDCDPCATCDDGKHNQDEEQIDCGGVCRPCPSCKDGVQNQGEQRVDCGGPCRTCGLFELYSVALLRNIGIGAVFIVLFGYFSLSFYFRSTFMLLARQDTTLSFFFNKPVFFNLLIQLLNLRAIFFFFRRKNEAAINFSALREPAEKNKIDAKAQIQEFRNFFAELQGLNGAYQLEELFTSLKNTKYGLIPKITLLILARRLAQLETNVSLEAYTLTEVSRAKKIAAVLAKQI